jgi:hypothetical protein
MCGLRAKSLRWVALLILGVWDWEDDGYGVFGMGWIGDAEGGIYPVDDDVFLLLFVGFLLL